MRYPTLPLLIALATSTTAQNLIGGSSYYYSSSSIGDTYISAEITYLSRIQYSTSTTSSGYSSSSTGGYSSYSSTGGISSFYSSSAATSSREQGTSSTTRTTSSTATATATAGLGLTGGTTNTCPKQSVFTSDPDTVCGCDGSNTSSCKSDVSSKTCSLKCPDCGPYTNLRYDKSKTLPPSRKTRTCPDPGNPGGTHVIDAGPRRRDLPEGLETRAEGDEEDEYEPPRVETENDWTPEELFLYRAIELELYAQALKDGGMTDEGEMAPPVNLPYCGVPKAFVGSANLDDDGTNQPDDSIEQTPMDEGSTSSRRSTVFQHGKKRGGFSLPGISWGTIVQVAKDGWNGLNGAINTGLGRAPLQICFISKASIPVIVNVISTNCTTDALISTTVIKNQMKLVNAAYKEHNIVFNLKQIRRTKAGNSATSRARRFTRANMDTDDALIQSYMMEPQFRGGGKETLHIFIVEDILSNNANSYTKGFCYYPQHAAGAVDGCIIRMDILPGVAFQDFNTEPDKGTLIHEIGHWLNLPHTFDDITKKKPDGVCKGSDGIADTTALPVQWSNCPSQFTCTGDGVVGTQLFDIWNWMSYSPARKLFTRGQRAHMLAAYSTIRAPCNKRNGNKRSNHSKDRPLITRLAEYREMKWKRGEITDQRPNLEQELIAICSTPDSSNVGGLQLPDMPIDEIPGGNSDTKDPAYVFAVPSCASGQTPVNGTCVAGVVKVSATVSVASATPTSSGEKSVGVGGLMMWGVLGLCSVFGVLVVFM